MTNYIWRKKDYPALNYISIRYYEPEETYLINKTKKIDPKDKLKNRLDENTFLVFNEDTKIEKEVSADKLTKEDMIIFIQLLKITLLVYLFCSL